MQEDFNEFLKQKFRRDLKESGNEQLKQLLSEFFKLSESGLLKKNKKLSKK